MKTICFFIFFSIQLSLLAQQVQVKNINIGQEGPVVVVNFDITSSNENELYNISLLVSTDGGQTYSQALKKVSGDVGFLQKSGIGKQIRWNALDEVSQLVSDNVVFKIIASVVPDFARKLIFVEGGTFVMGKNDGAEDEKPEHEVTLDNFYLSAHEVTVKEYRNYCKESNKLMPEKDIEWIDNHPMTFISWDDANNYCLWISEKTGKTFRLPTEAEWEFAAKGGNKSKAFKYSGSNNMNDVGWSKENSQGAAHSSVASLSANELGLYDLSGNVWEWCQDWYNKNYYAQSSSRNPKGPRAGTVKIAKGGSWLHQAVPLTFRFFITPTVKCNYVGFRVLMEP